MNIREKISSVIVGAKKYLQEIISNEPNMDFVFQEQFFFELYYLYPGVSSKAFSVVTNIPQIKIDQFTIEKYGLDFLQLCNKYRIEHFLSKNSIVVSEDNLDNFSLKGTGFTSSNEFKNALKIYDPVSMN